VEVWTVAVVVVEWVWEAVWVWVEEWGRHPTCHLQEGAWELEWIAVRWQFSPSRACRLIRTGKVSSKKDLLLSVELMFWYICVYVRHCGIHFNARWTICARVINKSEIRYFTNKNGEGKLFSVTFADESVSHLFPTSRPSKKKEDAKYHFALLHYLLFRVKFGLRVSVTL
jgi:hypothetical protein